MQTELFTAFDEPFDQHFSHLGVRRVDVHGKEIHALGVSCAQNFRHREAAFEALILVSQSFHAGLGNKNAAESAAGDAFVANYTVMSTIFIAILQSL